MVSFNGKPKWRSSMNSEAALNATLGRTLDISDSNVAQYGPFDYFRFENTADEIIDVYIDGYVSGTTAVLGAVKLYRRVLPNYTLEIIPYENGKPDIIFQRVAIVNTDAATNTSAGEMKWWVGNF